MKLEEYWALKNIPSKYRSEEVLITFNINLVLEYNSNFSYNYNRYMCNEKCFISLLFIFNFAVFSSVPVIVALFLYLYYIVSSTQRILVEDNLGM